VVKLYKPDYSWQPDWQSADTAPKDGTVIVGRFRSGDDIALTAWFDDQPPIYSPRFKNYWGEPVLVERGTIGGFYVRGNLVPSLKLDAWIPVPEWWADLYGPVPDAETFDPRRRFKEAMRSRRKWLNENNADKPKRKAKG
jgi:hypothetical protein